MLSVPLCIIFQQSLDNGLLPKMWKHANIVPVYKGSGSRYSVENYRLTSLTSTICKVMESIIYDKICNHCSLNNLLSDSQHGFRKLKSTTSNLLEFLYDITGFVDEGNNVDVVTVDFSKAFDKVSHNLLLHKLEKYGIKGNIYAWISDFLKGRTSSVIVNSCHSQSFNITSSVPQESILGPLMYIICANDIAELFTFAKVKMYADDLTIYAVINNENDRIAFQKELDKLQLWCSTWGLIINYYKCKVIHIGYSNLNYSYKLGNSLVKVSICERILGVQIDNKLSFRDHVFASVKKASNVCNLILSNVYDVGNALLIQLYKTYARPYLDYASIIYSPHRLQLIDAIERVQRNFTKRLYGLRQFSYVERQRALDLESLELRRIRNDLVTLYKLLHGRIASSVSKAFKCNNVRGTRGHAFKLVKIDLG